MSLASSPDFQIRPEDKVFDTFFPTEDPVSSSFDEYFYENRGLSDGDNKETFNDFLDFFQKEATARTNGCLSPIGGSTRQDTSPPQPWRKGLWCLNQDGASLPGSVVQTRSGKAQNTNRGAWNRSEVGGHEPPKEAFTNFSRPVLRSRPHTPSHKGTKRVLAANPRTMQKSRHISQSFSREGTLSPESSYARNKHNSRMAYQESLQRHLQNFHLLASDETEMLSTPSSGRPTQPWHSAQVNTANLARNGAIVGDQALTTPIRDINSSYPPTEHGPAAVDLVLDSVAYSNGSNTMSTPHEQALNPAEYLHDPHDQTDTIWTAQSLQSPIEAGYQSNSHTCYRYLGEVQQCWLPPTTSATDSDTSRPYQEHYPIIAAPTPQRPTHQLLQSPVSPRIDGLGIQYSGIDSSATSQAYPSLSPLKPAYSYPPLPEISSTPIHNFADASPFTTPRHHYPAEKSPPGSTSPSISPTSTKYNYATTSRSLRQSSPTRQSARRKSIGAPKASSFTNSQHHYSSSNKALRTPRTPKTPTGSGFGAIDFVNFTPKDSAKLLSDVAPSGSSKTRARREQEARDKRRKLSEAAVRAVRQAAKAAGGDVGDGEVEALERAILA
jgi:hypothetical protein